MLLFSVTARFLAFGGKLDEESILGSKFGPGPTRFGDWVRFFLFASVLIAGEAVLEQWVKEYAAATESMINERRALSRSNGSESKTPADGREEGLGISEAQRQYFLVDLFFVKVLLVFFPDVGVQRMTFQQAARAATSSLTKSDEETAADERKRRARLSRRYFSASVESGLNLLTFHRNILRTKTSMTSRLIQTCTLLILVLVSVFETLRLGKDTKDVAARIFKSACIVRVLVPLSSAAAVIMEELIERTNSKSILRDSWRIVTSAVQFAFWMLTLMGLLSAFGFDMSSYISALGLSSIVAAFALQAVLKDMLATVSILADRPFAIGDKIVVDDVEGNVVSIGFRCTRIKTTYNGEILVIPNTKLSSSRLLNRTRMETRRVKKSLWISFDISPENLERVPDMVEHAFKTVESADFVHCHLVDLSREGAHFEFVFTVDGNDSKVFKDAQHLVNMRIFKNFRSQGCKIAQQRFVFPSTP